MTIKIGFGYKARRGKDTACKAIVEHYLGNPHVDVRQYAFADDLRWEVNAAVFDRWVQDHPGDDYPFEHAGREAMRHLCEWAGVPYDTNAPVSKEYPYGKQRALYQWWGTEYRRAQDADYWVKKLAHRIRVEKPRFAVISDMRFFNEFEFCDYRVRCDRPGFEIADGAHHISEVVLDALPASRWDAVIEAVTVEDVERQALGCFGAIRKR